MDEIEVIQDTVKVLTNQVRAFKGRTEGRDLNAAERKTLDAMEVNLRANQDRLAVATEEYDRKVEARQRDVAGALAAPGRPISAFRSSGDRNVRGSGGALVRETADPATASFRDFVRTGVETRGSMSSVDGAGGYLIPNPIVVALVEKLKAADPIMDRASFFGMVGGNTALEIPVQSALGANLWVGETDARPETASPTFSSVTLQAYEVYANWMATQVMLDSIPDIDGWVISELAKTLIAAAGARFATGTGVGQIQGLFANTVNGFSVVPSGAVDALVNTAFAKAFYTLPAQFHKDAVWVMAPATLGAVSQFAWPNLTDTPLVSFLPDGTPTLMGKPVLIADGAPAVGNGAHPVFFGSIANAYAVGMHTEGVRTLRDPYTNKPYISFYSILRVAGHCTDNQAGVLIKSDDI